MIARLLRRFARWIERRFERPRFNRIERAADLHDVDEDPAANTVVLAGPAERPKWAVFMCPCDRGHRVALSLQASHWPHWTLELDGDKPTFYPSIDVPNEWRCHYWIRRGLVRWAPSLPRS